MRRGLVVLVVLLAACSSKDPLTQLPKPEKVELEETTTTSEPDYGGVRFDVVPGSTTTSVAIGPGPMTVVGKVEGPDGVVAGAIVELERFAGSGSAITRVPTAADGTWNLANVLGGRYRIRAWRAPDLASHSQLVFLEAADQRAVDITVEAVGGVRVDAAVAPDPPPVDERANLKVRVAERIVDRDGIVRDSPVAGVSVTLAGSGDWEVDSPNPSTTGGDGSTIFRVTCDDEGVQPLFATLEDGESYALAIAACVDATPTTTTSTFSTSSSTSSTTSTTEP